jgi:hypothetical protein
VQAGAVPWTDGVQLLSCMVPPITALLLLLNLAWLTPIDSLFSMISVPRALAVLLFGFFPPAVVLWYAWWHDWTFVVLAGGSSLADPVLGRPFPTADAVSRGHRLAPWALCASIGLSVRSTRATPQSCADYRLAPRTASG